VFNAGQLAFSAGLAGLVYSGLGGRSLVAEPDSGIQLLAATSAALTIYVSNVLLVGLFVSTLQHSKLSAVLREQGFLSYGFSMMVLALLGVMVAQLLALGSWWGLLLLIMPFLAARRTFRVYAELTEAYTSTVRSLVTAIEAKDPYTRGHSERVAVYARKLAERMALSRADLDLLERAALLHDVGKIGIELDTLTSPAQLSGEEVRAIRRHPVIGSELVGDVEFLSDVVPIVRHHHERFDGAGYPDGLIGESIPLLARVLAVADSYDAMTSDRAYRPGMSQEQALVEIARVAGRQLDRDIARQFSALIADGPVEGIG
jgi:putative nucleotidyltransferase with HDIG domain